MKETQQSISHWAEETFGPAGSDARIAARANEEMAELLRNLTLGGDPEKAAEECADVVIVVARLAQRLRHPIPLPLPPVRSSGTPLNIAARANHALGSALLELATNCPNPGYIGNCISRVVIDLYWCCSHLGFSLPEQIDRKMAINRARQWKLDGSGHGYHVKEGGQ